MSKVCPPDRDDDLAPDQAILANVLRLLSTTLRTAALIAIKANDAQAIGSLYRLAEAMPPEDHNRAFVMGRLYNTGRIGKWMAVAPIDPDADRRLLP
jgi:hypothetical protein